MDQVEIENKKQNSFLHAYDIHYKKMMIIPLVMLVLAISFLGIRYMKEGQFIDKDVSLKGGISITIPIANEIDILSLKNTLSKELKDDDIEVRSLKSAGKSVGIIINANIDGNDQQKVDSLISSIEGAVGLVLNKGDYSLEFFGSSLGNSFYKETTKAVLIAFLFMSIVVFIFFRVVMPSLMVVSCAIFDIIVTFAIVSFFDIKLSSAGIAAFLMLIGYSVDTDIVLTNKVLKTNTGTIMDRVLIAMKTGLMMTSTTFLAVLVALIFTKSEVIGQIMTILIIGLCVDIIGTWIQNVSLLRWYIERKSNKQNG